MTDAPQTEPLPAPKTQIQSGGKIQAIVPQNIEEAFRMAEAIFLSGMYPESYAADSNGKSGKGMGPTDRRATTSRIMIGIQKSMEIGMPPISGLSSIYIVNNRPTIYGDGVPALLYASGKITIFREWTTGNWGDDDYTAHCEIKRKDMEESTIREFSWADAKKANLTGKLGPWTSHPKRQLQMRARGFAARDGAADILNGLGIYEEVIDLPEKNVPVDTSSLDDDEPTPPAQAALPQPDNADVLPDITAATGLELELEPATMTATQAQEGEEELSRELGETYGQMQTELLKPLVEKAAEILGPCPDCQGKGIIPFSETDPETGEVTEGTEPCETCKPKKAK